MPEDAAAKQSGDGGEEPGHPGHAVHSGTLGISTIPPFTFQLPDQPSGCPPPEPVIQNLTNMSISGTLNRSSINQYNSCDFRRAKSGQYST